MTQFVPKFGDHGIHLILQMEFLLFELNFFEVVLIGHVMAVEQLVELALVAFVFLKKTAKLWVLGHQVFLDLLLLHHHRDPPKDGLWLWSNVTVAQGFAAFNPKSVLCFWN
jgi:hypothetical protein